MDRLFLLFRSYPAPVLDRLTRFLASASGSDKVLMIIQYFSKIVIWYALRKGNGGLADRVRNLANPVSDYRILSRFTGLIPLVHYMRAIELNPPPTRYLHQLARLENLCNFVYYPLEHAYWLGAHNIIPSTLLSPAKIDTIGVWSCRFWAGYVVLHFLTLREEHRLLQSRKVEILADKHESSPAAFQAKLEQWHRQHRDWWVQLVINTAYFPLTIHWSNPKSKFPDVGVGICGTIAALAQLYSGWKATV
ncbi:peroxisomal biogenesis factor 11 [Dimargaris cristalligena]|uniref:Peroxisomal biogenesis factor 11 n=1 Tax=Dimargaris cristalligena TaxID=215637 RepID=A0A4P9ZYX2_9FUNG|nr:peroxisomal biogenesis factor 11 [Dimargaris cristalligena]|eukprot:RKP38172.1 peroxisomal biogenesis factor 11 [Dimargaris cristalligena]